MVTPLLRFMRALTKEQRNALAAECRTTMVYLYQLAAQEYPNPTLRFARRLVAASKAPAKRQMTAPLTLDDLLQGTADDSADIWRPDLPTRSDRQRGARNLPTVEAAGGAGSVPGTSGPGGAA